jgi:hypothetical protein
MIQIFRTGGGGSRVPSREALSQQASRFPAIIGANMHFGKSAWEHTIRNDRDFERCADYIHFNPVKHRLVSSPSDWPFSSLHRYVRAGILTQDWGRDGHVENANFGERAD